MIPILFCMALLPAAGFVYQSLSSRRDAKEFPPLGEKIDVEGYQLHIQCLGEARPGVQSFGA